MQAPHVQIWQRLTVLRLYPVLVRQLGLHDRQSTSIVALDGVCTSVFDTTAACTSSSWFSVEQCFSRIIMNHAFLSSQAAKSCWYSSRHAMRRAAKAPHALVTRPAPRRLPSLSVRAQVLYFASSVVHFISCTEGDAQKIVCCRLILMLATPSCMTSA